MSPLGRRHFRRVRLVAAIAGVWSAALAPAAAQEVGRDAALRLRFAPLEFHPPEPELHVLASGVRVLYLQDSSLPLVDVFARFRGGFSHFPREYYAAASAVSSLIRSGGTRALTSDSLDALLERYAVSTTVGGGGESSFASLNTLTRNLDVALDLFGAMLRTPRFDSAMVEVWRGQELESVRRRGDEPGRLAYSEFNRLMFGDHPIGWEMDGNDLEPRDLTRAQIEWVHQRVFCPENLVLGVTGDVTWAELVPRLEHFVGGWPACPERLARLPVPKIRTEPGIVLIPRPLEQSTVVMAHIADLRMGDTEAFYASRIGSSILGSGGLSSRLMTRVRSEKGYAYSASSLWTAPRSYDGLVGAVTQTKAESTVATIRLILSTMEEMTQKPPTDAELSRTIDEFANGFVFNFESPAQIVARRMSYLADGLPDDWLQRYLAGIQKVSAEDVREVFAQHLHPDRMVILVLGDPARLDEPLERLGPLTVLDVPDEPTEAPSPGR
ncbi:MAG: insulinase family protein [Gemmatimonadetes bacterium]|nr:insulinase family protein [Gemmatimonadota bacterium]